METIEKTQEKIVFVSDMNVSLANAIRRSVDEIPILAIDEADIYKNDSVLYDEILSHRLGLIPIKNQKLKVGQTVEMKLKCKGKEMVREILSGELGDEVVYPEMPIVLIGDCQEVELVARARVGKGITHAKFSPGIVFYKHLANIKISGGGEKQSELAEIYPEVFEMFGGRLADPKLRSEGAKLKVKNATACDLDQEDMEDYPGVDITFDNKIVFTIESWGQLDAKDIFTEACKALKGNLSEVSKVIK